MGRSLSERAVSGVSHLIALAGIIHLVINLIGYPLFPKSTILWLIPNTIFAFVVLKWSRFVWSHVVQALSLHVCGIALTAIPWAIRMAGVAGLMGERWSYTGWEGSGVTPAWSLMTLLVGFISLIMFTMASEACVRGFAGEEYRYPLWGRLASRMTE